MQFAQPWVGCVTSKKGIGTKIV